MTMTEAEWAENMGRACPCIVRTVTFKTITGDSWTREIVEYRSPYCAEHNPEAFWPERGA